MQPSQTDITFREVQSLRPWFLWIPFAGLAALFVWGFVQQEWLHIPFGDRPAPSFVLALLAVLMSAIGFLFHSVRLEVEIDDKAIHYRFLPFIPSRRTVEAGALRSVRVRTYKPILEYGGWGFRVGLRRQGKAYTVSGDHGIQLVFTDGTRLLLGTRIPFDAERALQASAALGALYGKGDVPPGA
ncbi:MAG: hypothetical protein ACKOAX_12320 [Candidatus Kapaibacterium sp.]